MKNGVVLELFKKHVAVLTTEGEFLKIRKDPQLCYIGEEIWFRESDIEIPGVLNKLKKRIANPKFIFQGAALATGFLLFFSLDLDTYVTKAIAGEGFLENAFEINKDRDTENHHFNQSPSLASNDNNNGDDELDDNKDSLSDIISTDNSVALANTGEQQTLYASPSADVEDTGNSLSAIISNGLTGNSVNTPGYNNEISGNYSSNTLSDIVDQYLANDDNGNLAALGILSQEKTLPINNLDKSTSHYLDVNGSVATLVGDNNKVDNHNLNVGENVLSESKIIESNDTSTEPELSKDEEIGSVNSNLPDADLPTNKDEVDTPTNTPHQPVTLPNVSSENTGNHNDSSKNNNSSNNSSQKDDDLSNLPPEYVAGLETGKDKSEDKNEENNSKEEDEKDSTNSKNGDTNSNNESTNNSSSTDDANVDMSATCEKDGYYYENEKILTFEKDDQGKVVEVYKDVPIKKYCDKTQDNSGATEAPTESTSTPPAETESNQSPSETETPTETGTQTPDQSETQSSVEPSTDDSTEQAPADESLTFG